MTADRTIDDVRARRLSERSPYRDQVCARFYALRAPGTKTGHRELGYIVQGSLIMNCDGQGLTICCFKGRSRCGDRSKPHELPGPNAFRHGKLISNSEVRCSWLARSSEGAARPDSVPVGPVTSAILLDLVVPTGHRGSRG
jgi:hypothetical protein